MVDKNTNLKFWGVGGLAVALLLVTAAAMGIADSCDVGFAALEIRKKAAAGCGEFWLNRYQTLITGIASSIIAIGAAYLVLRSLDRMDHSNQVAERAVLLAEKQRKAEERRQLSAAVELTGRFHGHWNVLPLAIGDALRTGGEADIRKEFSARMKEIQPLMEEFRRIVPPILSTSEEKEHYREFIDRSSASFLYFFKGAAKDYGMDVTGISEGNRFTVSTIKDVVRMMVRAGGALMHLQHSLSKHLDQLD